MENKNYLTDYNYQQKNDVYLDVKYNSNIEQLQMLTKCDDNSSKLISPQEQFKNDPHYQFNKKFGINYCRIGNIICLNFDSKKGNIPKICIGPQWYLSLFVNFLIIGLTLFVYITLIKKIANVWKKYLYFFFSFLILYFFDKCALINPGIVQNKKRDNDNIGYCSLCEVYFNPANQVEHCSMCNVCVEKIDHHCVWVGKCVAKNNLFSFYAMLVSIGIYYLYIILMCLFGYEKIKKKGT